MKLTRSRTLAEAARSPAGPAFVDVSLSPSFKLKSIPKLFLSEEGEERRKLGGADTEGMGVAGDSRWQGTPGTLCLQSLMRAHGQVSGAQDCLFTAPSPSMLPTTGLAYKL